MTILGLHVLDREWALFWCDSEVFYDAAPTRSRCKMAVNAMAATVGAGLGWGDLAEEGCRVLMAAASIDDAVDALPDRLRKAAVRLEAHHRGPCHTPFGGNVFVVAGWSPRDARIVGYSFTGWDFFQPTIETLFAAPLVDLEGFRPTRPADVLPIARTQIVKLRESYSEATGCTLCIADLRPDLVTAMPVHNFAAGGVMTPPVETVAPALGSAPGPALRVVDEAA